MGGKLEEGSSSSSSSSSSSKRRRRNDDDDDYARKQMSSCTRPRKKQHLYLALDDWDGVYSIHRLNADDILDQEPVAATAAAAGELHKLPEPPAVRISSPTTSWTKNLLLLLLQQRACRNCLLMSFGGCLLCSSAVDAAFGNEGDNQVLLMPDSAEQIREQSNIFLS